MRSSLHTLTATNNTSTPARRVEKPTSVTQPLAKDKTSAGGPTTTTDVASVVNLGGAGSRRTVYLDENLIKTEGMNRSPSSSINMGHQANVSAATSSTSSTTGPAPTVGQANVNGGGEDKNNAAGPTTLLMYNRISNIISPLSNDEKQQGSDKFGSSSSQTSNSNNNNNNKGSLEDKEKESAIWYEYGCV